MEVQKRIIENFNYFPSTPYASSKASIDMYLKNLFDNYKFPVYLQEPQIYMDLDKNFINLFLKP